MAAAAADAFDDDDDSDDDFDSPDDGRFQKHSKLLSSLGSLEQWAAVSRDSAPSVEETEKARASIVIVLPKLQKLVTKAVRVTETARAVVETAHVDTQTPETILGAQPAAGDVVLRTRRGGTGKDDGASPTRSDRADADADEAEDEAADGAKVGRVGKSLRGLRPKGAGEKAAQMPIDTACALIPKLYEALLKARRDEAAAQLVSTRAPPSRRVRRAQAARSGAAAVRVAATRCSRRQPRRRSSTCAGTA